MPRIYSSSGGYRDMTLEEEAAFLESCSQPDSNQFSIEEQLAELREQLEAAKIILGVE